MSTWQKELFGWVKAFIVAFIIVFAVKTFLFTPIIVDGPSMRPTLHDRDQVIVNKIGYRFGDPKRFDVVVFHATKEKDYIKRVIGLPGDHVKLVDGQVYINGEPINEPFLEAPEDGLQFPISDFKLEQLPEGYDVIPDGYIFVLGDNRSNSTDSRTIGLVPIDSVVGKASFIYWPLSRIQKIN